MTFDLPITNPLPKRYSTADAGIGGVIKQRNEDFIVDELPLYDPSGDGEHLYLGIQKTGVAHGELMSVLRRHFSVPPRAIGYAGMKDKHGVTRQAVSIHLPGGGDVDGVELPHERIAVMWAMRHRNKIRRGHLAGNRFSIRIREVEATKSLQVHRILQQLERIGVPAYFGTQRFGYRSNNHLLGAMLLSERWEEFVHEVAGTGYTPFPEYQRERRELADRGDFATALTQWSPADRTERQMLQALRQGRNAKSASLAVDRTVRAFFVNAFQSAIFNRVLDERIDADRMSSLMFGDLAWKHDTRNVFEVTEEELATGELQPRLDRFEISPSGPIWGNSRWTPMDAVAATEQRAFDAMGISTEEFVNSKAAPDGERRPLRIPITHVEVEGGVDEHGGYVRVAFDLPRGSYATVVLRELMKNDTDEQQATDSQNAMQDEAAESV